MELSKYYDLAGIITESVIKEEQEEKPVDKENAHKLIALLIAESKQHDWKRLYNGLLEVHAEHGDEAMDSGLLFATNRRLARNHPYNDFNIEIEICLDPTGTQYVGTFEDFKNARVSHKKVFKSADQAVDAAIDFVNGYHLTEEDAAKETSEKKDYYSKIVGQ